MILKKMTRTLSSISAALIIYQTISAESQPAPEKSDFAMLDEQWHYRRVGEAGDNLRAISPTLAVGGRRGNQGLMWSGLPPASGPLVAYFNLAEHSPTEGDVVSERTFHRCLCRGIR